MSKPCSNSFVVSPSTPLAPRRFICFQVSVRNSGVSRCASDVKRSFGFDFAFFAIWSSCVDILLLPLGVQGMFPWTSHSTCPAASPCTRLSRAQSTTGESDFHRRFCLPQVGPFGRHTRFLTARPRPAVDLPGAMPLPFPPVPCSQTPPDSPTTIASSGRLLLPSRFSTLSASGYVTRLNRFTCVTAWTSLCLRLTHVVTFMSPRLDSRWGGSSPFRGGNLTR